MLICNGLFSFPVLLWHIPGSNTAGARLWVFWAMVLQHSMTATTNMGSHVRKISFTLAFSIADLRRPRKNYLLRPASASIVRRGFGPWPQWQREGSVMFLSKRQRNRKQYKLKVTRWLDDWTKFDLLFSTDVQVWRYDALPCAYLWQGSFFRRLGWLFFGVVSWGPDHRCSVPPIWSNRLVVSNGKVNYKLLLGIPLNGCYPEHFGHPPWPPCVCRFDRAIRLWSVACGRQVDQLFCVWSQRTLVQQEKGHSLLQLNGGR